MNQVMKLSGPEPREIIQEVIQKRVAAILSYSSHGKWHVSKIMFTDYGAQRLNAELCPNEKPRPINIQTGQRVGVSIKYGYGKFIFDTKVHGLEPGGNGGAGAVVLAMPERLELVQRRSYFRVKVPDFLKVEVKMCRRSQEQSMDEMPAEKMCKGTLVDLSAGGLQVAAGIHEKPVFKKGQFIVIRFVPVPYEKPLTFAAQIRNVLPTADQAYLCYGLQTVGLEASPEGRQTLSRLVDIVENYYHLNRAGARQYDKQAKKSAGNTMQ